MQQDPITHKRLEDDMEQPHSRVSDQALLELVTSLKLNTAKLDDLTSSVGAIKKNGELVNDRLLRVEFNQEELSKKFIESSDYVKQHAKDEEAILQNHVNTMINFQSQLEGVQRGFPKNNDGDRDPRSHADDHENENAKKKDINAMVSEIRKWVLISFLAALGTGLGYLLVTGTKVELSRVTHSDPKAP